LCQGHCEYSILQDALCQGHGEYAILQDALCPGTLGYHMGQRIGDLISASLKTTTYLAGDSM
jgi:hypothetical protein